MRRDVLHVNRFLVSWNRGVWDKIGGVVGGPGEDDSTMAVGSRVYQGQQYDFVFDVDVEDGAPPKKLPYNRGGNPYDAADRYGLSAALGQRTATHTAAF